MVDAFKRKFHVAILAAGIVKELKPLTNSTPKPLVCVNDEPILTRLIKSLPQEHVESLTIVVGHLAEQIVEVVSSMDLPYRVNFYKNADYANTHCSSSLIKLKSILDKGVLFFNSDVVFSDKAIREIFNVNFDNSFVVCKNPLDQRSDLQKVLYDNDNIIKKWSLVLDNFNADVIGPVYISQSKGILLQKVIEINKEKIKQLPCFTFLSSYMVDGDTKVLNLAMMMRVK